MYHYVEIIECVCHIVIGRGKLLVYTPKCGIVQINLDKPTKAQHDWER